MTLVGLAASDPGWTPAIWATFVVAAIGLVGVAAATWQKQRSDRREQWWKRTQWALEWLDGGNLERRVIAITTLSYLSGSSLAQKEEREYLLTIASSITEIP